MSFSQFLESVRTSVEVLAALAAALYFGYKILAGWLLLNMSVALTAQRMSVAHQLDHLVVNVRLTKGTVDSIRLLDGEIRVTEIDPKESGHCDVRPLTGLYRLAVGPERKVQWDQINAKNRYLNLSTGEAMQLAEHFRVKPDTAYRIEVAIQGDRFRDRWLPSLSQWRSATVSLPGNTQAG